MAQEENYIAIVSERLSRPGDTRYVIIEKQTQQEVDNCNGHGYKSAASAHKSFSFKMRRQQQSERARQMRSQYQTGASRPSAPADLVSPFVQEASAGYQRSTVVRDDGAPAVTRVNSWSGYAPRRASAPRQAQPQSPTYPTRHHRRQQDVTQENTPRPSDLFDFSK